MQFTLQTTRRTPHGASRLLLALSAWLVKTRRSPSRHSRDARVCGHTTTAMHKLRTSPHPPPRDAKTDYSGLVPLSYCLASVISCRVFMRRWQKRERLNDIDDCASTLWHPLIPNNLMFDNNARSRERVNTPSRAIRDTYRASNTHGRAYLVLTCASSARTCRNISLVLIWP